MKFPPSAMKIFGLLISILLVWQSIWLHHFQARRWQQNLLESRVAAQENTIILSETGPSPQTLTVQQGEMVTWLNSSSETR